MPEPTSMMTTMPLNEDPPIADLYHVAYIYYSCIGFGVSTVVGLLVSFLTCKWIIKKIRKYY